MSHRVTMMMNDDNFKKLRLMQAKLLKQTNASVSFSKVINDVITLALKNNN
jgi:hypothetical protein